MGRFAVLGLLLAGAALAPGPGAAVDGRSAAGDGADPAARGERLVLAVVGNERSASAVHGERVLVADPGARQVHSRRLPGGTLCHGPLMAAGDRVIYTGYRGPKATLMSLPLTLTGAPSPLPSADTVVPSARPGHVWLGRWDQAGKRTRATFREVAVPGEAATSRAWVGSEVPPPGPGVRARRSGSPSRIAGPLPSRWNALQAAALPGGFVIETRRTLAFWDGHTARPLRGGHRAWPVASGGGRFAWCRGNCRSVRVRTPTWERAFRSPANLRPTGSGGSFSPDGHHLAVAVAQGRRTHAAVLDLRSGEWSMVRGRALSAYGALAWSTTRDRLYLATRGGGLRAWRPGAQHAETLPIDPGGTVMSISIAP
jgi:hypothetical protein